MASPEVSWGGEDPWLNTKCHSERQNTHPGTNDHPQRISLPFRLVSRSNLFTSYIIYEKPRLFTELAKPTETSVIYRWKIHTSPSCRPGLVFMSIYDIRMSNQVVDTLADRVWQATRFMDVITVSGNVISGQQSIIVSRKKLWECILRRLQQFRVFDS